MARKKDLVYERLFASVLDLYKYEAEGSFSYRPKPPQELGDFKEIIRKATLLYER